MSYGICLSLMRSSDPFLKKDWYDIKAPTMFTVRNAGKTLVTRTAGTKVNESGAVAARRSAGITDGHDNC